MKRYAIVLLLAMGSFLSSMSFGSTAPDDTPISKVVVDEDVGFDVVSIDDSKAVTGSVGGDSFLYVLEPNKELDLVKPIIFEKSKTNYRSLMYRHEQLYLMTLKTQSETDAFIHWRRAREGINWSFNMFL